MQHRTRAKFQASIRTDANDRSMRCISQRLTVNPGPSDPDAATTFDTVLAHANGFWGALPGVRLLKVTAVACGMLPLVKHIPPSEQATAEELDVADMVRRLGQILAARLDCDFTRRMVAGTPDNDLVAFLRVCAQLQLRPTLVEIRDGDDDTEDDAGDEGLPPPPWGDVIAYTPDHETARPDVWLEESDLREKVAAMQCNDMHQ